MDKLKNIERVCKNHGNTRYVLEGRGYYRCAKCRSESVVRRRKKLKKKAIEYLGGKCEECGYSKCDAALEFHHKKDFSKEFGFSQKGITRSWEKIKIELDKCVLVCCRCHKEIHYLK